MQQLKTGNPFMTLDELNRLIAHPEELDTHSLAPLAELVETYPYAQSIVMLYLLNLSLLGDLRYEAELQHWAPHLPSREKLYLLTQLHMPLDDLTPIAADDSSDSFALVDLYLRQVAEQEGPLSSELEYETVKIHPTEGSIADYFSTETCLSGTPEMALSTLIPIDSRESSQSPSPPSPNKGSSSSPDGEEPSDTLFTETLATIYIKQGHYDRAKKIIEGLSLKYPEKISYFAVQLDFLGRLIDNSSHP